MKYCNIIKTQKAMETKEINIAALLKDCPKGTKLYSPICGECEFLKINPRGEILVYFNGRDDIPMCLNEYGFQFEGGECLLFPSKEVRDWGCFNVLYVTGIDNEEAQSILKNKGGFYIGENIDSVDDVAYIDKLDHKIKVVSYANYKNTYILSTGTELKLEEEVQPKFKVGDVIIMGSKPHCLIPHKNHCGYDDEIEVDIEVAEMHPNLWRLATPEEIDKWNKETLEPNHLHYSKSKRKIIHWFLPFDKVIVRAHKASTTEYFWKASLFSNYDRNNPSGCYWCVDTCWAECLPYNGETAKLIGTTDDYNEETCKEHSV